MDIHVQGIRQSAETGHGGAGIPVLDPDDVGLTDPGAPGQLPGRPTFLCSDFIEEYPQLASPALAFPVIQILTDTMMLMWVI